MACDLHCTTQHELANLLLWHANDPPCGQKSVSITLQVSMSWWICADNDCGMTFKCVGPFDVLEPH